MEYFLAIIERLLTFIEATAWPLALLILSGRIFRQDITQLLGRLRGIGREGVLLDPDESSRTQSQAGESVETKDIVAKLSQVDVPEGQWHQEIRDLLIKTLETKSDPQTYLFDTAMSGIHFLQMERTYARIWGSQVRALQYILTTGPCGEEQLKPFFEVPRKFWEGHGKKYELESWLGFLTTTFLVHKAQDADKYSLTIRGAAFLDYLSKGGMTADSRFL